jgi:hypothetical protein
MERVLVSAVLPIMPLLFQIPWDMQLILSLIYFLPDTCAHLNVRFPMGRMITFVNSPQWHRIHHSAMPEHRDKNFASLLPLWDILFGTAWVPNPDEYPATGFDPPVRVSVIDSIIWPFRRAARGLLVRYGFPGGGTNCGVSGSHTEMPMKSGVAFHFLNKRGNAIGALNDRSGSPT